MRRSCDIIRPDNYRRDRSPNSASRSGKMRIRLPRYRLSSDGNRDLPGYALILYLLVTGIAAGAEEIESTSHESDCRPANLEQTKIPVDSSSIEQVGAGARRVAYKYIGNAYSMKFHRPSCPFARAMWRRNVVRFPFRKDAIGRDFKPCKYCLPPFWKSVGAKILKAPPLDANGASSPESAASSSCKEAADEPSLVAAPCSKAATDEGKR